MTWRLSLLPVLLFGSLAVAEDGKPRPGFGPPDAAKMEEMKARMLEAMKNGQIPDEIKKRIDRNGDGTIDAQEAAFAREMMAKMQGGRGGGPQFGAPQGFDFRSGQIPTEIIKKFDKNGDGQLDDAEKKTAMETLNAPQKSRNQQLKEKLDTNGDGKIDESERKAAQEAFKSRTSGKKEK